MKKSFVVETSARHIHVTKKAFEILCGKDAELKVKKALSQPSQFVSETRLDLVGPKNTIKGVSILGPFRNENQVEISATDARTLGVPAIIRESGNIVGSAPIKIVGPAGELELKEGCIVAKRHIHMTPEDAKAFHVKNGQIVKVLIQSQDRKTIFDDTVIRVSDKFKLAMHIDTDESNASNAGMSAQGLIVKHVC